MGLLQTGNSKMNDYTIIQLGLCTESTTPCEKSTAVG